MPISGAEPPEDFPSPEDRHDDEPRGGADDQAETEADRASGPAQGPESNAEQNPRRRPAHEDDLHVHDYEDAIVPTFETKFGAGCGIISMLVESGAPRAEIVTNIKIILNEWHTAMARLPEDLLVRVEALTELYDDLRDMTDEPSDDARARIAAELARLTLEGPEEYA